METDEKGLNSLYENAQKMNAEGKVDEAIKELEKILESDPNSELAAKATNFIGDIYYDKEDYVNAEVYFKEAIKIDPTLIEVYRNLGHTYFSQEKYDDAIVQYEKAIDANPDTELKAECLRSTGDVYRNQEKYDDAIVQYEKAIDANPDKDLKAECLKSIGDIYINQVKYDDAIVQYEKAIDANPDKDFKAECLESIGYIYLNQENYIEAEKNYREAIKFSPHSKLSAKALYGIGRLYRYQEKTDTAIENFKEAIKIDPDLEDAHKDLAVILYKKKMKPEALLELNEAIRINPNNSDYYHAKGNIYGLKQYQKAIEAYKEAIKIDPTDSGPYTSLAYIYEKKKEKEKAIEVWINCLKYADFDNGDINKTDIVKKLKKLEVSEKEIEMILNPPPKPEEKKEPPKNLPIVDYSLMDNLIKKTFLSLDFFENINELLEDKRQLIFYGVPGTGKTFVAKKFAKYFTNCASEADLKNQFQLIQFHQSYSYEEFMEGIRPETIETSPGKKEINYSVQDGIFKKFCKKAKDNSNEKFLLIIDEINRGNISKIFGELLFLLEYRDDEITLPYSKEQFSIPDNVYIIGTMNTADRSIAFVDYALRRRFYFVEFLPNKEVLEKWLNENPQKMSDINVLNLFTKLNEKIKNDLDEHHQIGHSYFMIKKGILDEKRLKLIWDYNIMPLLKEYFFTKRNLDDYSFESMIKS